jgi:hypothetical protein
MRQGRRYGKVHTARLGAGDLAGNPTLLEMQINAQSLAALLNRRAFPVICRLTASEDRKRMKTVRLRPTCSTSVLRMIQREYYQPTFSTGLRWSPTHAKK